MIRDTISMSGQQASTTSNPITITQSQSTYQRDDVKPVVRGKQTISWRNDTPTTSSSSSSSIYRDKRALKLGVTKQ
jgi:hypothetical protein